MHVSSRQIRKPFASSAVVIVWSIVGACWVAMLSNIFCTVGSVVGGTVDLVSSSCAVVFVASVPICSSVVPVVNGVPVACE